ncbi:hypothetical protein AAVH_35293, partial [Aphelenchoides avenae]
AWLFCGATFTVAIVLLVGLYKYNKRMKIMTRGVTLTARYQYAENVATLRVIVPAVSVYGFWVVIGMLTFPRLFIAWSEGDRIVERFMNSLLYLYPAICAIVCPLAFMLMYPPLNYSLRMDLAACTKHLLPPPRTPSVVRSPSQVQAMNDAEIYFQQLRASWNAPARK